MCGSPHPPPVAVVRSVKCPSQGAVLFWVSVSLNEPVARTLAPAPVIATFWAGRGGSAVFGSGAVTVMPAHVNWFGVAVRVQPASCWNTQKVLSLSVAVMFGSGSAAKTACPVWVANVESTLLHGLTTMLCTACAYAPLPPYNTDSSSSAARRRVDAEAREAMSRFMSQISFETSAIERAG